MSYSSYLHTNKNTTKSYKGYCQMAFSAKTYIIVYKYIITYVSLRQQSHLALYLKGELIISWEEITQRSSSSSNISHSCTSNRGIINNLYPGRVGPNCNSTCYFYAVCSCRFTPGTNSATFASPSTGKSSKLCIGWLRLRMNWVKAGKCSGEKK